MLTEEDFDAMHLLAIKGKSDEIEKYLGDKGISDKVYIVQILVGIGVSIRAAKYLLGVGDEMYDNADMLISKLIKKYCCNEL